MLKAPRPRQIRSLKCADTQGLFGGQRVKRFMSIGQDPWLVKEFSGEVKFKRRDAAQLTVTALDLSGYPAEKAGSADQVKLRPTTMYYLIQARP